LKNLKNKRVDAGLTQNELAALLGVNQSTIASWEVGTKYPSADKLPDLARVLGCMIDELFTENEEKEAV